MITLVLKNKRIIRLENISDITIEYRDFISLEVTDPNEKEIKDLEDTFDIDCSIMKYSEDIEISSHFVESENQVALHYSIPYFIDSHELIEEDAFMILTQDRLFYFMSDNLQNYFQKIYAPKIEQDLHKIIGVQVMFQLMTEFISDYFADVTEYISKQILNLAKKIFRGREVVESDLDTITDINFNNLLVRESLNETYRIFSLFRKSSWSHDYHVEEFISSEMRDFNVVSDYIQSNFDRLDDLKENVSNKIDLEQNKVIKMLTMVTFCIALPTLIAGIYGMNFKYMPELNGRYSYPIALLFMLLSAVLPLMYFKRKKWL